MQRAALLLLPLFVLACGRSEPPVTQAVHRLEFDPVQLDFGTVPIKGGRKMTVTVRNVGQGAVSVHVNPGDAPIEVEPYRFSLAPGQSMQLAIRFLPREQREYEGLIRFETGSREPPTLPFRGRGVERALQVEPAELDFGQVPIGSRASAVFTLESIADGDLDVRLGLRASNQFEVDTSPFVLGGRRTATLEVSFVPRLRGNHRAWLEISPCANCLPVRLTLTGTGVAPQLFVAPPEIRFESVPPGFTAHQEVLLRNDGTAPLRIEEVRLDPDFTLFELALDAEFPLELKPNETVRGEVRFGPPQFGTYHAELLVRTGADEIRVDVSGRSEGPLLVVDAPASQILPLGSRSSVAATIRNLGEEGEVDFASAKLIDAGGAFVLDAFAPVPAGNGWTLPLSLRAEEPGLHQATLRIETRLPFQPVLEAPLEFYVPQDGCELRFDPSDPIRLGIIDGDRTLKLDIEVRHEGEGECLIWDPRVEDGALTLVDNPVNGSRFLSPGESVVFRLRRSQSPYGVAQPAVQTRFVLSHTRAGGETEIPISFQQVNPFPIVFLEPIGFPDTPVGKESMWRVNVQLRPGYSLAFQSYSIVDDEGQFELSPVLVMNRAAVMFRPTSEGPKSALLEIRLAQHEEPVLVELEANALPACDETCDWPSTSCSYEVQAYPAPPPFNVVHGVVVHATPEPPELSCQWYSTTFIGELNQFDCHGGSFQRWGTDGFSTILSQLAWDEQGRVASCELPVELPTDPVEPE
ncbi:MAG: choice-of-anchor D domain-containing protein [Pseudomonadota bacterium]